MRLLWHSGAPVSTMSHAQDHVPVAPSQRGQPGSGARNNSALASWALPRKPLFCGRSLGTGTPMRGKLTLGQTV
jgi:hypothetical protein